MKRMKITVVVLSLLLSAGLYAAIGCMDDSYYLQRSNDHKTRHYVSCNCPCSQQKILSHDSKCLVCFHYHEPKQWKVIRGDKEVMTTEQYTSTSPADNQAVSQATERAMTDMIVQYKKNRAYREKRVGLPADLSVDLSVEVLTESEALAKAGADRMNR